MSVHASDCPKLLMGASFASWDRAEQLVVIDRADGYIEKYARTDYLPELVLVEHQIKVGSASRYLKGKILDAGTGGPQVVTALDTMGFNIHGVDIALSPEQLAQPRLFSLGDLMNLPFPDDFFDTVITTWSVLSYESAAYATGRIESTGRSSRVLAELRRVAKVGAMLLISPIVTGSNFSELVAQDGQLREVSRVGARAPLASAYTLQKIRKATK